jgi:putative transposase
VLKHEGLFPNPDRRKWKLPDTPWRHFLEVHMNTIVACDFLAKEVITPLGMKTAYLLMFIHLETRKVFVSPATFAPVEEWVVQQARNVRMWLEDAGIEQRFILRDNDKKFTDDFDEIFTDEDMEVITIPYEAPNANAYSESWIGNFKREVLNHFMCFSLKHLDYIAQQGVEFYNNDRPHQSKGNAPLLFPGEKVAPQLRKGEVACQERLHGLLKSYYRKAA